MELIVCGIAIWILKRAMHCVSMRLPLAVLTVANRMCNRTRELTLSA